MLTIDLDQRQIAKLSEALDGNAKRLPREIKTAINATSRKTKTQISKDIRKELAAKAAAVNATLSISRKATDSSLGAAVRLKQTARIPLRDFGARQTKQGVSYKTSKKGGRKTVTGGFIIDSIGKHAFKRQGKSRLPIQKLKGPSPWGVFVKQNMRPETVREANAELRKQIDRRIRFITLKKQGAI